MPARKRKSRRRRKKKKSSARKRTVKAVKKLSRRTKARPTRAHDGRRRPRKKPRTEELLKEENW